MHQTDSSVMSVGQHRETLLFLPLSDLITSNKTFASINSAETTSLSRW
jgi:hypothetical protein